MGVGRDFSTWITDRIKEYEFVEGTDFILCSPNLSSKECGVGSNGRGGHNTKDYYLSLSMTKGLSMLQNNDQGKQARKYFIKLGPGMDVTEGTNADYAAQSLPSTPPQETWELIPHEIDGYMIPQRKKDGYVNATAMCKASGNLMGKYLQIQATKDYLRALSMSIGFPIDLLTEVISTGKNEARGTWVHPRVAVDLARWCSPAFAIWVIDWLYHWM